MCSQEKFGIIGVAQRNVIFVELEEGALKCSVACVIEVTKVSLVGRGWDDGGNQKRGVAPKMAKTPPTHPPPLLGIGVDRQTQKSTVDSRLLKNISKVDSR